MNLSTGLEDPERVTAAFLVGRAAARSGRPVTMLLVEEAVRLAVRGAADGVACDAYPPLETVVAEYEDAGGRILVCPFAFAARGLAEETLVECAEIGGATPLLAWIGEGATVFSY